MRRPPAEEGGGAADLLGERGGVGPVARLAGVEHALQAGLRLVAGAAHGLVGLGRREAEPRGGVDVAALLGVLGLEGEELGLELDREVGPLGGERVERDPGPGEAPQVELEVREVQERLAEGGDPAGPPAHVDRGLQVADGRGHVALGLGDDGEVEPGRGHGAGVAGLLGGGEGLLVGLLGVGEVVVALEREGQRSQRDREDPRLAHAVGDAHRRLQRGPRLGVAGGEALRQAPHRDELAHDAPEREREPREDLLLVARSGQLGGRAGAASDLLEPEPRRGLAGAPLRLGVVAGAEVGARPGQVEAPVELSRVVRDRLPHPIQLGQRARGVAAIRQEARPRHRDLGGEVVLEAGQDLGRLLEVAAVEDPLQVLPARARGLVLAHEAIDVGRPHHRRAGEAEHDRAEPPGPASRAVHHMRDDRVRQRGDGAPHQLPRLRVPELRHGEHLEGGPARARRALLPLAQHQHQPGPREAGPVERGEARLAEPVRVVDQHHRLGEPPRIGVERAELDLERLAHVGHALGLDPRHGAEHAERPGHAAEERAPARSGGPGDDDAPARGERRDLGRERARRRVERDDGPDDLSGPGLARTGSPAPSSAPARPGWQHGGWRCRSRRRSGSGRPGPWRWRGRPPRRGPRGSPPGAPARAPPGSRRAWRRARTPRRAG